MKATCVAGYLIALAMTGNAFADGLPATFDGVNGTAAFGYYVGPYYGTVDGGDVTFYCVDFANEVYFGEQWQVNLTVLDGSASLANTRYGGAVPVPNALTLYREAAWLTTQYASNPNDYGDIQATIWQLFDPQAPVPTSDAWLELAEANYTSLDFSRWDVVTNVGPVTATGQVQEFLIDPTPVPEPAAIVLLGSVLILGFVLLRRRSARL